MAGQSGEVVIVPRNFVLLDELDKSEKARRKPPAARPAPRALSGTPATVAGGWGHDVLLRARAARRHLAVRSTPARRQRASAGRGGRVCASTPPPRRAGTTGTARSSARPAPRWDPRCSLPRLAPPLLPLPLLSPRVPLAESGGRRSTRRRTRACQVEGRILQLLIFCGKEYPKAAPQARRRPSAGLERLLLLLLLPRTVEGRAPHAPRAARRR